MKTALRITLIIFLSGAVALVSAQSPTRQTTITVLEIGDSGLARLATRQLRLNLALSDLLVADYDQTRAAMQGAGYAPSLNMVVTEARTFGAALGTDFYVLVEAQPLRRSPSSGEIYFDAYASIFLISSRSGRLIKWQRLNFQSSQPTDANNKLLSAIAQKGLIDDLVANVRRAEDEERTARAQALEHDLPVIDAAPNDEKAAAAEGMRLPKPFRRLQPEYPDSAAAAEAEGVVDVVVDLDVRGEVTNARIERWAGFGLDEVTLNTVRKLHFFPAMRNGNPIPLRVLLRYNFRKPPK